MEATERRKGEVSEMRKEKEVTTTKPQSTTEEAKPPRTMAIRWCPACGRDDRVSSFKNVHYSRGELCHGVPIPVEYVRQHSGGNTATAGHSFIPPAGAMCIQCGLSSLAHGGRSPASAAPVVDNLLSRLVNELEQAVAQGYQPNLLNVVEAKRLLTTKPLTAIEAARSAASEILDFLNFDCENDEVKQDISNAAYIISKYFPSAAATAAPVEPRMKWDRSGLKEACQRALKLGRTHQEVDIQLFLDMLLEIERLEAVESNK